MPIRARLKSFCADRQASVGILFAITFVPILFGVGFGLDYVQAARKREKLDGIADAAALGAITPSMMTQTPAQAKAVATSIFLAQEAAVQGVTFSAANLSVTVSDNSAGTTTTRQVSVAYTASSPNVFGKVIGMTNFVFSGVAKSSTTSAPNIDFYVMLDTSPSMAIAATQAGIDLMVSKTSSQGGCAFACHQTNPAADNLGNPNGWDNYALARSYNVTLRMDLVTQAAQNLMDYAQSMETSINARYRMAVSSFDVGLTNVAPLTADLGLAKTQAGNAQLLTVYKNGWLTAQNSNNDQDTNWDAAINAMNLAMPNPGTGTNNAGDTPQEILFIVTDGVSDEANGGRKIFAMGGTACDVIKSRGIKIAILYTTYNPLPTNAFYNANVKPFQPNIGTTLQTCASSGLYNVVNTGDDISSALNALFNKAVTTAHLTQ